MASLGTGVDSEANGVSADGAIVVGRFGGSGFRWTSEMGAVSLGASSALDVSADGNVVVGDFQTTSGFQAGRWTETSGWVPLGGFPPGVTASQAWATSGDGEVVVGNLYPGTACGQGYRWTVDGGVALGGMANGICPTYAHGVSDDGSVVVGVSFPLNGATAGWRWTADTGVVPLGPQAILPWDASADGSVIVGSGAWESPPDGVPPYWINDGFIWTESDGVQRLTDVLIAGGATGLEGWSLNGLRAITDDGKWVVGTGTNPLGQTEAFLANISPIPIPAAVWLLGSALGVLGWVKRLPDRARRRQGRSESSCNNCTTTGPVIQR